MPDDSFLASSGFVEVQPVTHSDALAALERISRVACEMDYDDILVPLAKVSLFLGRLTLVASQIREHVRKGKPDPALVIALMNLLDALLMNVVEIPEGTFPPQIVEMDFPPPKKGK